MKIDFGCRISRESAGPCISLSNFVEICANLCENMTVRWQMEWWLGGGGGSHSVIKYLPSLHLALAEQDQAPSSLDEADRVKSPLLADRQCRLPLG